MMGNSNRGPDVTVLASSPNLGKGRIACTLNNASARAWVLTYLQGVQTVPGSDPKAVATLDGETLYFADEMLVRVFLDAFSMLTQVIVESRNPHIQGGPWMSPTSTTSFRRPWTASSRRR